MLIEAIPKTSATLLCCTDCQASHSHSVHSHRHCGGHCERRLVHFERCGTAQGTAVAAQIAEEMGDDDDAARLYRSAAALGYARASALENDAASRKTEL